MKKILLKSYCANLWIVSPLQQHSETNGNVLDFEQNIQQRLMLYLVKDLIWKSTSYFLLSFARQVIHSGWYIFTLQL